MNLRQSIELAGMISAHSPNLIDSREPLPDVALARYRDNSRARLESWKRRLAELPAEIAEAPPVTRTHCWQRAEPMLVDIFAADLVARVWGAVLTACSRARRTTAPEQIAREVLDLQMSVHDRTLRLLTDGPFLPLDRLVALDRLQKTLQRWTDLFLGHLVRRFALRDFPFDLERSLDFGEEQLRDSWSARHDHVWELYFVCLRSLFPATVLPVGIFAEWRDEIFRSMLACLAGPLFLEDGLLKSVRLQRLLSSGTRPEGPAAPIDTTKPETKLRVSQLRDQVKQARRKNRG